MKFCIFCMYGYSRSWYNDLGRRWTRFVVIEKSERLHFSIHILIFRWRNGCKWASRLELQARLITYLNDIAGDFIPIPKWNSRGRNCPDDQLNKLNLLEIVIDFYLSSNSRTYIRYIRFTWITVEIFILRVRQFKVREANKAETSIITMTQASRMIIDPTK